MSKNRHYFGQEELISLERSLLGLQGHPHAVREGRRFAEAEYEYEWRVFDHLHCPAKPVFLEEKLVSEAEARGVSNILNCVLIVDAGMDVVSLYEDNVVVALGELRGLVREAVLIFLGDLAFRRAESRRQYI